VLVAVQTITQIYQFFQRNHFDATFSTVADKRQSRPPSLYGRPAPEAVKTTLSFLKNHNELILEEMVEEMKEGHFSVEVTADMLMTKHGLYLIAGGVDGTVRALGYERSEVHVTTDRSLKSAVVKVGGVFHVKGETRTRVDGIRYSTGVTSGCEAFSVVSFFSTAGFAFFAEGTVHMLLEQQLRGAFAETGGTHMVGTHSEAFMVHTKRGGDGDVGFFETVAGLWREITGEVVEDFGYSYQLVK
jgi:hypothetical protein